VQEGGAHNRDEAAAVLMQQEAAKTCASHSDVLRILVCLLESGWPMLVLPLSGWSLTFAAAGLALLTTVAGLLCKCVSHNTERQDERHRSSATSTR
jgi:hypothetical protein